MGRSRQGFIIAACLLAMLTTPALAQPANDEELFNSMMKNASDLYNAENYTGALLAYLEVKSRFGSPVADYSLGRTYQQLYQCDKAMTHYTFVMSEYDLPDDHPLFTKSANYYNELTNCMNWGQVEVTCDSPNARLLIEDKPMGRCKSGTYIFREGKYTFRIEGDEGDNVEPVEIDVRVTDGSEEAISLKLPPIIKEVTVEVPVAAPTTDDGPNWLAWGLVGGGTALIIAGGFTNAAGFADLRDAQAAADRGDTAALSDAKDSANLNKILTGVLAGIGVAAAGTGLALAIIDLVSDGGTESPEAGDVSFSPSFHQDGGGLLLKTTF